MSGDDDTFDIDLYGNEEEQQDLYAQETSNGGEQQDGTGGQAPAPSTGQDPRADEEIDFDQPFNDEPTEPNDTQAAPPADGQKQGTKRKAPTDEDEEQSHYDDNQIAPVSQAPDPNATAALKLSELHWWTTEEDLRGFCARAGAESELKDLTFGEHKINGKAKGEAYLEFASAAAASKAKKVIEREIKGDGDGAKKNPYQVWYTGPNNPFRNSKDAGGAVGAARKDFNAPQGGGRGGAYNNFPNRGNFGGRGNFNQNRGGGGGGYGNNNFQNRMGNQQQQQGGGWGMNGNFGGGAGGGMGGMGGMGGFGNMQGMFNPGMMMQNMMGRGGFGGGMGGMGMGNMGGGMRGGGGMMGRGGGWGGGGGNFGQGGGGGSMMGNGYGGQGGGGGYGQGQQNKRPKME